jgi:hypothetical protein
VGARARKALSIVSGTLLMVGFVAAAFAVLTSYAGGWGVPYFGFTTPGGTRCTNTFTGYDCSSPTLADVEDWGDIELPDNTSVVSGTYHSTHDYALAAVVEVPASTQQVALQRLNQAFGGCVPQHPAPATMAGLTRVCILANDDSVVSSGEPTSRIYTVGTGLRRDGSRVIDFAIRSR